MVYFLKLVVSRDLHHTTFASVLDIILILASTGLLAFYFASAIINRPREIVYKPLKELYVDSRIGQDYDYYHCLCKNKTIPFEYFIEYDDAIADADEAWCTDPTGGFARPILLDKYNVSQTGGPYGGAMCVTCSYKLRRLLRTAVWRFSRDNIVTSAVLNKEIKAQIDLFVFDIWNIFSDSLKVQEIMMTNAIMDGGLGGNVTKFHPSVAASYAQFLQVESSLEAIRTRLFSRVVISHQDYIESCDAERCYIDQLSSVDAILLSAIAIVGGNLALFTAFGNGILKYVEDRYMAQLFQKYLTGQITEQEKEFLTANSPHMATLVDDDPKGLPPGTTMNDLRRLKSQNKGAGTQMGNMQVNVASSNSGPTPI
jgi:hypothetical protein